MYEYGSRESFSYTIYAGHSKENAKKHGLREMKERFCIYPEVEEYENGKMINFWHYDDKQWVNKRII